MILRSGYVSVKAILQFLELEPTGFLKKMFSATGDCNCICFHDWVLILWDFCTHSESALSDFIFNLYDKDSVGAIKISEIETMLMDIYGKNFTSLVANRGFVLCTVTYYCILVPLFLSSCVTVV